MNQPSGDTGRLAPGLRVRDRIWGGTETGTVTRVDRDGDVVVQWDSAKFTEDQRGAGEVEAIPGSGDPTLRYVVWSDSSDDTNEA